MRRIRFDMGDGLMTGVEFGSPVQPVAALWLHATGFNAMTYQSILAPLGLRTRVAAVDLRGHGRNTTPTNRSYPSWSVHVRDVISWLEKYAPQGVVLGGHSMGGCVAAMIAGKRPDLVRGLVLVDPVILPPAYYRLRHLAPFVLALSNSGNGMARAAKRRRSTFPSQFEARERYKRKPVFKSWREPFLSDYLLDGIDRVDDFPPESEEQIWQLLCAPSWEAATFKAQRNRPWNAIKKITKNKIPAKILRASSGSVMSKRTVELIRQRAPAIQVETVRGSSHFLPMEVPYSVRDELSGFIARLVEGFSAAEEGAVQRTLHKKN